ncbi:MAG: endospore germination permease [Clostridiales bacterium]|jgi:spore germination protein (amino acid permease)/Ger(x)C family germination protein|nr:endospore germination permease [Clostridiales bacterium]
MQAANEKISARQFQILFVMNVFGTGVLSLPAQAAQFAKQDAWIAALISVLFALLSVFLITSLGRVIIGHSFSASLVGIISKPVAYLICALFAGKLIVTAALQLRISSEMIKHTLLARTPLYVIAMLFILLSFYAASFGIETRARLAELLFLAVFLPTCAVLLYTALKTDYTNILPVLTAEPKDLLKGGLINSAAFTALELCLISQMFAVKREKLRKSAIGAVILTGVLMCFVTVITICAFGYPQTARNMWAVSDMFNAVSLPGSFVERQDAISAGFWIVSGFMFISAYIFYTRHLLFEIVKKGKRGVYTFFSSAAVFFVSLIPRDLQHVYEIRKILHLTAGLFFMLVFPLTVLIAVKLRKGKSGKGENGKVENRKYENAKAKNAKAKNGKAKNGKEGNCKDKNRILKIFTFFILATAVSAFLVSCENAEAPDKRKFVTAIGIDKADGGESNEVFKGGEDIDKFKVTIKYAFFGNTDDASSNNKAYEIITAPSLTEAFYQSGIRSSHNPYFGHVKACIVSRAVLEDRALFSQTLGALSQNDDISKKIIVLASEGSAESIINEVPDIGIFTARFYKKDTGNNGIECTLGELLRKFSSSGDNLLPVISAENEKPLFGEAAAIKDYRWAGHLSGDSLNGYIWVCGNFDGRELSAKYNGKTAAVKLGKIKRIISIYETGGEIIAEISINANGQLYEDLLDYVSLNNVERQTENANNASHYELSEISEIFETEIEDEIKATARLLQKEYKTDAYGFLETLRKYNYELYSKISGNWDEAFEGIRIVPIVNVDIKSAN